MTSLLVHDNRVSSKSIVPISRSLSNEHKTPHTNTSSTITDSTSATIPATTSHHHPSTNVDVVKQTSTTTIQMMNESRMDIKDDDTKPQAYTKAYTLFASAYWLTLWFVLNIGVTMFNKKALNTIRLPATLTCIHMICNTIGAYLYIYYFQAIERKTLRPNQKQTLLSFSIIFVSNIITGNWSLGLVSISFNQVMRALVPALTVIFSIIFLRKSYSILRKLALLPIASGVIIACTGDNSATIFGYLITIIALLFAALKVVLSSKILTSDMSLHPVDLILHQAPLSAAWCLLAMFAMGEWTILCNHSNQLVDLSFWYIITGILSFVLNVTSFFANKATSALTLSVCGNIKQMIVILLSIFIHHDIITEQKLLGISIVTIGGALYTYIGYIESKK